MLGIQCCAISGFELFDFECLCDHFYLHFLKYFGRYVKKMTGKKAFTICVDPDHFAPEIVTGSGYDYSVDLWAVGVLFFEMLHGRLPFGNIQKSEAQLYEEISSFDIHMVYLYFLQISSSFYLILLRIVG